MARARNIKPGFFKNELLVEQAPFVRLLFIGLWTLADREGRVEDRPKRIKLELFPYDDDDVDGGLMALADAGFIRRYQAACKSVIEIINFLKHQSPHGTEKDSDLPDENGYMTIHERTPNGYVTGTKRKNNVNSEANNVALPEVNVPSPLEPVNPPLDNALNPDSLNPEYISPNGELSESVDSPAISQCPQAEIVALYNSALASQGLPAVNPTLWKGSRADALRARWREEPVRQSIEWWQGFFGHVANSDFLMGRTKSDRPFRADLEWLVKFGNFAKVCEGKYHHG